MKASPKHTQDTKWVFLQKGTCSRAMFYILNREFGYPLENEECASDPFAGGIMGNGYQCGLLWGAVLGMGAESFRRSDNCAEAIGLAINASQVILDSFTKRAGSADCEEIVHADLTKKGGALKLMVSGKFVTCLKLADKWAPNAIKAAEEGLTGRQDEEPQPAISCASEVVRKMGGSDEEMAMVAGFAGGIALSGNACGALSAAIWMNSLNWCRKNPGKSSMTNPGAKETLEAFFGATDYEFLCSKICGKSFKTVGAHTEFIKNGGCEKLINVLAQS